MLSATNSTRKSSGNLLASRSFVRASSIVIISSLTIPPVVISHSYHFAKVIHVAMVLMDFQFFYLVVGCLLVLVEKLVSVLGALGERALLSVAFFLS
ncbi:MAG: hypothetical protein K8S18_05865 [Desulfobacula sp.]|nr:hypothetical protein [Desulfobacula sp.]